jgi:hypothetical protein
VSGLGLLRHSRTSRGRYNPLSIQLEAGGWSAASLGAGLESQPKPGLVDVDPHEGHQGYSVSGDVIAMIDFEKKELTLVDTSHKTFATFPASEFADGIAAAVAAEQMKAAQQVRASIKTKVDSKMTRRTEAILGVQAEEREITVSMDIPMLANLPQTGPTAKLVMQIWTAQPGEAMRVPPNSGGNWLQFAAEVFFGPCGHVREEIRT